ncbi:MAG: PQQ-binding-like beta-propeller repeat protein [Chloroflexota bacterium]|nr:PQQ-binding-like beta-propeller repeat protein [Chloroflexota bacterium]
MSFLSTSLGKQATGRDSQAPTSPTGSAAHSGLVRRPVCIVRTLLLLAAVVLLPGALFPARSIGIQRLSPDTLPAAVSRELFAAELPRADAGSWPMYGHDPARTNFNPDETALTSDNISRLAPLWQFNTGIGVSPTSSGPIVAGGRVYVGSSETSGPNFYALDAATGTQDWSATLGQTPTCFNVGIGATAAVAGGVVVSGGTDPAYYGLDATTGKLLWRHALDAGASAFAWASPLIVGGRAFIGVASGCDKPSIRGQVQAISLTDGSTLAAEAFVPAGKAGAGVWNSPALSPDGKTLAVSTGEDFAGYNGPFNRALVTLDPAGLAVRQANQQGPTGGDRDFATTPIIFHDSQGRAMVAAAHKDENFYAYALDNVGAGPLWQLHTGVIVGMMPAYDPTIGRGGTLFFLDGMGDLHGVDPDTGEDRWNPTHAGSARSNMALAGGMVFLNTGSDGLVVLSEATGEVLATYHPEHSGKSYSGVAVSRGTVYWLSGGYLNAWRVPAR